VITITFSIIIKLRPKVISDYANGWGRRDTRQLLSQGET